MLARNKQRLNRTAVLLGTISLCLSAGGCTASPASGGSTANPSSAIPSALTIDITIADGHVDPNGQEIEASVGQGVILYVKSDIDDELHAHVGLDGPAFAVYSGQTTTGNFKLRIPGTFLVESHRLGKPIVILNVR